MALNAYIGKNKLSQINNLFFILNNPRKRRTKKRKIN